MPKLWIPGSFDLVVCCNALPYMSDVPAVLRHWHSLLRAGGRLAFNCWVEPTRSFLSPDRLAAVLAAAAKKPLYGVTPNGASQLNNLRDEYVEEARLLSVRKRIDAEVGAYFALARKL